MFSLQWLQSFFPYFPDINHHIPSSARVSMQQELRWDVLRLWFYAVSDRQTIVDVYLSLNDDDEQPETIISGVEGCQIIQCFGPYRPAQEPTAHGFVWTDKLVALYLDRSLLYVTTNPATIYPSAPVEPFSHFPVFYTPSQPIPLLPLDRGQTRYLYNLLIHAYRYNDLTLHVVTEKKNSILM